MRAFHILLLLLVCSPATAQEFSIQITAKGSDPDIQRRVTFGFDQAASDEFSTADEAAYGELEYPPGDPGLLFRMVGGPERGLTISQDGGMVDIRKKPAVDSFLLPFRIALQSGEAGYPVVLRWDPTKIPAIIRHITLSSPVDPFSRTIDMKTQDTMMVNETEKNSFRNIAVRLYYNMDIPVAAVEEQDQSLSIFPNPLTANSSLAVDLPLPSQLSLVVVDVTGREVVRSISSQAAGHSSIGLGELAKTAGPLFARVEIRDARGSRVYTRVLVGGQ